MKQALKAASAAILAAALVMAPMTALAESHGGHDSHASPSGGSGGAAAPAGHHGGSWGGFHGGHDYYRGYYPGAGAFGLGLVLGLSAAYPGYYGYYPGYYAYPSYYSSYDEYSDDDGYSRVPPPPATDAGDQGQSPPADACGQWVWHADQDKYVWADMPCAAPAAK